MEKGECYKHFKGNFYIVESIATDASSLDDMVLYRRIEPSLSGKLWVRPLGEFEDIHPSGVKRFTNVLDLES